MNNNQVLLKEKSEQIAQLRKEIVELSKSEGLREVENYSFKNKDGKAITLDELFGGHDELIVIHNMGKSCPYCTLWADGFSSSNSHLQNRCAFVLISPNDYEAMRDFAQNRNWLFPYLSASETTFIEDMGFVVEKDGKKSYWPGFTTFVKKGGKIYRVACDYFGPGDFYSPICHFKDMLYHSDKPWSPKFSYE